MHEAALAQGLLETALNAVEQHNAAHPDHRVLRITELRCELGILSCVEPQTLAACFELLAEKTQAEGALLTLSTAPLPCRCLHCGHEFSLTQRHFVCPQCGDESIHFNGGHGMTLMALDVASEETDHD